MCTVCRYRSSLLGSACRSVWKANFPVDFFPASAVIMCFVLPPLQLLSHWSWGTGKGTIDDPFLNENNCWHSLKRDLGHTQCNKYWEILRGIARVGDGHRIRIRLKEWKRTKSTTPYGFSSMPIQSNYHIGGLESAFFLKFLHWLT